MAKETGKTYSISALIRRKGFRLFLALCGRYKLLYAAVLLLQLGVTVSVLLFAETSRRLFDRAPDFAPGELFRLMIGFVVFAATGLLLALGERIFNQIVNTNVVFRMREMVLAHLTKLSLGYHEGRHSSDAGHLLFDRLEIFKRFIVFDVLKLVSLPVSFLFVGVYLLTVHPALGVIAVAVGPLQLLGAFIVNSRLKGLVARQQANGSDVFFHMQETVAGMREIKMNRMEETVLRRFRNVCADGIRLWVSIEKMDALRELVRALPERIGYIAGVGAGAVMMASGEIGPGGLVAFITLLDKAAAPFASIVGIVQSLQRVAAGADKLLDVMETEPEDDGRGMRLAQGAPSISFENVCFAYEEDHPVLRNVTFSVPSGATVALVGPSGGGKSTIIKLLYRFYSPQSGAIRINGIPLRNYTIDSIRENLATVAQDVYLFDGTVRDNIAMGAETADEQRIVRAAVLSQSIDFIRKLPDGLDTRVGERGIKLSQGQKQRIAIARAIMRNASIVVLDEPTSALDVETEYRFQQDLRQWADGCTKLIIAHRLSTIRDADYVVFLEEGEVREAGAPRELLLKDGRFRRFWDKQEAAGFVS